MAQIRILNPVTGQVVTIDTAHPLQRTERGTGLAR